MGEATLLAHERHRAWRRDPLRLAVVRVRGGALFFLPVLPRLLERYVNEAELAADEAALRDGQERCRARRRRRQRRP